MPSPDPSAWTLSEGDLLDVQNEAYDLPQYSPFRNMSPDATAGGLEMEEMEYFPPYECLPFAGKTRPKLTMSQNFSQ